MSILVGSGTKVLVQGITGRAGAFHTKLMLEYGTRIMGGVTPGKGGDTFDGVPIFDTVEQAISATGADATIIFVPAAVAADAIMEAASAGIKLIVCITEGISALDACRAREYARIHGARIVGPNCPGVITPGATKIGIMPAAIHKSGRVGVISRSGTLTYEAIWQLTGLGIGQSTAIGIGGDSVIGTSFTEVLEMFERDDGTDAVVLIGEIGGNSEERAAEFIRDHMRKPVAAFIAGRSAPPGRRMGHAGAIVAGSSGGAEGKIAALREAGVAIAENPSEIGKTLQRILSSSRSA